MYIIVVSVSLYRVVCLVFDSLCHLFLYWLYGYSHERFFDVFDTEVASTISSTNWQFFIFLKVIFLHNSNFICFFYSHLHLYLVLEIISFFKPPSLPRVRLREYLQLYTTVKQYT